VHRVLLCALVLGVRLAVADDADDDVLETPRAKDGIPERSRALEHEWEHEDAVAEPDPYAEPAEDAVAEPAPADEADEEHPVTTTRPSDAPDARTPRSSPLRSLPPERRLAEPGLAPKDGAADAPAAPPRSPAPPRSRAPSADGD
jgi:hypothetical protein